MQIYDYAAKPINGELLDQQISALAIAGYLRVQAQLQGDGSYTPQVVFADVIAPADKTRVDTVVANHDASQLTAQQQAEADALAAQSLDQGVTDLASARTSYATDATALTNARTAVTNANATVQGLAASPSIANLTAAVKALSTAQAQADLAILNSLKDLADGELAIANALAALKARG